MNCDFDYCIYNKKSNCILDKVQLDSFGECDSCELITVPEKIVEIYNEKQLRKSEPTQTARTE